MARGLGRKSTFNPFTKTTGIIPAGNLTHPLYAGWVTAFIRTVISEILNGIDKLDTPDESKIIISTTTDGFLCNTPNLVKIDSGRFSKMYRKARLDLGESDILLEIKVIEKQGVLA
jgi:hypothetical protein